jgi:pilus assembly protein Flp/PilA
MENCAEAIFRGVGTSSQTGKYALPTIKNEVENMMHRALKLYAKLYTLIASEEGQDLVEYALVVALIAFGATAGMKSLAGGMNTVFGDVSSKLGSYVS